MWSKGNVVESLSPMGGGSHGRQPSRDQFGRDLRRIWDQSFLGSISPTDEYVHVSRVRLLLNVACTILATLGGLHASFRADLFERCSRFCDRGGGGRAIEPDRRGDAPGSGTRELWATRHRRSND